MARFLKQSTAATVILGPFVDATDGVTAETGLTISQADVRLSKNGAAFAQVGESSAASHMENGYYSKALNTTDTGTLGRLRIAVAESGALPVWEDFMIMPANVWDSLFGADFLQVDAAQWLGTTLPTPTVAGYPLVQTQLLKRQNTAQAGGSNTMTADASAGVADFCPGDLTYILSGAGIGQSNIVQSYVNGTKVVTYVQAWPNANPDNTSVYQNWKVGGIVPVDSSTLATAAAVGAVQGTADAIEVDTTDIQARIPAALHAGGGIKAHIVGVEGANPSNNDLIGADGDGGQEIGAV
jgi:hypothetical protein